MESLDCTEDGEGLAAALTGREVQRVKWRYPSNPGMPDLEAAARALATQPTLEDLSLTVDALVDEEAARVASLPKLSALRIEVAETLPVQSIVTLGRARIRSLALGAPAAAVLPSLADWPLLSRLEIEEMYPSFGEVEALAVATIPALTELVLAPHHLVATSVRREGVLALAPLAKRLRVLVLDGCWEVDETVAELLLTFESLEYLAIRRTRIGPTAIAELVRRVRIVESGS